MRKLLTRYQVDPAFLRVLFSFGDGPNLAESGSSNILSQTMQDGSRSKTPVPPVKKISHSITDTSYQIRYSEENLRSTTSPWSIRQTGVYHHHSFTNKFDLLIFLHPLSDSALEKQLVDLSVPRYRSTELLSTCENPYRLHILPFATYLDNWRWYFRHLGDEFQEKARLLPPFKIPRN